MATINGKPSLYLTPSESPTESINPSVDYQTRISEVVAIATEMVTETETEITDEDYFNDPEFQAEYNEYLDGLEREWRNDPEAQRKFDEWCDEQERLENENAMFDTMCEAHDAEASELASLGDAARSYIAGHDRAWQVGVNL